MTAPPELSDSDDSFATPALRQERRTALELRGLTRAVGRKLVLNNLNARFAFGELTLIGGQRGSGKSLLISLIQGLSVPDRGEVLVRRPIAPPVSTNVGFSSTGAIERDLSLRAAAYGLDTSAYIGAIARLLDDPNVLRQRWNKADSFSRTIIRVAASYLVPSDVYLTEGPPVPPAAGARHRIGPLFEAARQRATVISLLSTSVPVRSLEPERLMVLEGGRLQELSTAAELAEHLT